MGGSLARWVVRQLAGWVAFWVASFVDGRLVGRQGVQAGVWFWAGGAAGSISGWASGGLAGWPVGGMASRFVGWPAERLAEWPAGRPRLFWVGGSETHPSAPPREIDSRRVTRNPKTFHMAAITRRPPTKI